MSGRSGGASVGQTGTRRARATRRARRPLDDSLTSPAHYAPGPPSISLKALLPFGASASAAAVTPALIQRQQAITTTPSDPALTTELDVHIRNAEDDAKQDDDLMRRAYGSRLEYLLRHHRTGPISNEAELEAFIGDCERRATTELDTLAAFPVASEVALVLVPKGFPLTWAGRIKATLSLGIRPETIIEDAKAATAMLDREAQTLPPGIESSGLPVGWKEATTLKAPFRLLVSHATAPSTSAVSAYARVGIRYTQLKWVSAFAFSWEANVERLRESVADGTTVLKTDQWKPFIDHRASFMRDLPARARDRISRDDQELEALGKGMADVQDAAIALGMASGLTGLLSILGGWQDVTTRFDAALAMEDTRIPALSDGGRFLAALRWLWANGYLSGAAGAQLEAMLDQLPETLGKLGGIVIAGLVPGLNVPLAYLLAAEAAKDAIGMIDEVAESIHQVFLADSVVTLQRASARLASSISGVGIIILTILVEKGIAKAAERLRSRAAAIEKAEPTLTRAEAERRAFEQMPAEERRALESPKLKAAQRVARVFDELGGSCSIGSVICRDHSKPVLAEAGAYPKVRGVPMPRGIFRLQKAALVAAERRPQVLQDLCMANRKRWPHFDKAVTAAGGKWPRDANNVSWQVHHVKPVQFGGESELENLFPLPAADHLQYTNWWGRLYWAYRRRFTDEEWELIYWNERGVYGSQVRKTPVKSR